MERRIRHYLLRSFPIGQAGSSSRASQIRFRASSSLRGLGSYGVLALLSTALTPGTSARRRICGRGCGYSLAGAPGFLAILRVSPFERLALFRQPLPAGSEPLIRRAFITLVYVDLSASAIKRASFFLQRIPKGLPQNKVYHSTLSVAARRDRIVPLWVLVVGSDVQVFHLLVADFDP